MTKHTAEFLRARSSNLSLRAASTASSQTPPNAARPRGLESVETPPRNLERTTESKSGRRTLCPSCAKRAGPEEYAHPTMVGSSEECALCGDESTEPKAFARPFCDFLNDNPTVFHAVDYFKGRMDKLGFKELPPKADWTGKVEAGGSYYVTRNGSSIVAFKVGKAYRPGNGVAMIAGHIDALTTRLKPVSTKPNKAGCVQLGVAPYAGALNQTWWDRDLSIGGRVVVRDEDTGKVATKLVKLGWPIAKIPTLAPHFGAGMLGSNNKETQMVPIIGLDNSDLYPTGAPPEPLGPVNSFVATQPPKLVRLIASELGIKSLTSMVNWELEVFDSQPATVLGMDKELISAGRIDDKLCCFSAFMGLLNSKDREDDGIIRLVAFFDDEEIGSLLRQGAKGNFLPSCIERAVEAICAEGDATFGPGIMGRTYASSFLVSADVTHAAHPNFLGSYLDGHAPRLNVGLTVCADSNGHVTTDGVSAAIMDRVAQLSGCTNQVFMIRNDSRSGGTVGPTISSMLGVKSADAGLPQLSMHSIRATTGALDPGLGVKFFRGFFENWEKINAEWE